MHEREPQMKENLKATTRQNSPQNTNADHKSDNCFVLL